MGNQTGCALVLGFLVGMGLGLVEKEKVGRDVYAVSDGNHFPFLDLVNRWCFVKYVSSLHEIGIILI